MPLFSATVCLRSICLLLKQINDFAHQQTQRNTSLFCCFSSSSLSHCFFFFPLLPCPSSALSRCSFKINEDFFGLQQKGRNNLFICSGVLGCFVFEGKTIRLKSNNFYEILKTKAVSLKVRLFKVKVLSEFHFFPKHSHHTGYIPFLTYTLSLNDTFL